MPNYLIYNIEYYDDTDNNKAERIKKYHKIYSIEILTTYLIVRFGFSK